MTPQERLAAALRVAAPYLQSTYAPRNGVAKDPVKVRAGTIGARTRWGSDAAGQAITARILAADPDLAQDIADGASLRLLREALPDPDWSYVVTTDGTGFSMEAWNGLDWRSDPEHIGTGSTIAEAADACRAALEAVPS